MHRQRQQRTTKNSGVKVMCKVERIFMPVGQGAFYKESLCGDDEKITMVYDCGTLQSEEFISKRIEDDFQKNEVIDFLVISHFHKDHISGIDKLLKHCNVKRLFLPFLSEEASRLIRVGILSEKYEGWETVLNYLNLHDEKETKIGETDIYYVVSPEQEERDLERLPANRVSSGENLLEKYDEYYKYKRRFYYLWYYVPFNLENKGIYDRIVGELQKIFKGKNLFEELKKFCDDSSLEKTKEWENIKDVYKEIYGKGITPNVYSLLFYSGPCDRIRVAEETIEIWEEKGKTTKSYVMVNREMPRVYIRNFYGEMYPRIKPGCLYTGDYCATKQWKPLYNAFKKYWNEIGCIQMPHHGSENGFHENFLEMHNILYIASAGHGNSYHHPSLRVWKYFQKKRKKLHVITEEDGLKQTIYLYW